MRKMQLKFWVGLLVALGIFLTLIKKGMIFKRIIPENNPVFFFSKYRKLQKYIGAMAKYESGNYTNKLSKDYFNIFSMTKPSIRPSISISSTDQRSDIDNQTNRWQIYNSYTQAVEDLFLWFDFTSFPTEVKDLETFALELKNRGYYTANYFTYVQGLKKYL